MLTPSVSIVAANVTTTLVKNCCSILQWSVRVTSCGEWGNPQSTAEIIVGMHGKIATQNFYNAKEEFIDHFTHDIWFLDSIERRHTLAFTLYALSITDDRQP